MSILAFPRINFSGELSTNPCTCNNDDVEPAFVQRDSDTFGANVSGLGDDQIFDYARQPVTMSYDPGGTKRTYIRSGWNLYGDYTTTFENTKVTSIVATPGYPVTSPLMDPLIGVPVSLLGSVSSDPARRGDAMLCDLDPTGLVTTQLWIGGLEFGPATYANKAGETSSFQPQFNADTRGFQNWLNFMWVSAPDTTVHLEWVQRNRKRLGPIGEPGKYSQIALSPDDKRLAVELPDATGRFDIWIIDVLRGVASRLTSDPTNERDPVWSPGSDALVYSSDATGDQNLLRKSLLDSRPPTPLPAGSGATPSEPDVAESWSRNGNTLFFVTLGQERTVWTLDMNGNGRAEALIKGRFLVDEPHVSPDGRSFAYVSTESGRAEIYVSPVRQSGSASPPMAADNRAGVVTVESSSI